MMYQFWFTECLLREKMRGRRDLYLHHRIAQDKEHLVALETQRHVASLVAWVYATLIRFQVMRQLLREWQELGGEKQVVLEACSLYP